jgi:photosystem II stability/assembly factor-like uncharacterized protein
MLIKKMLILSFFFFSNKLISQEIPYSKDKCHARGIIVHGKFIYVSTNTGKVYKIHPLSGKSNEIELNKTPNLGEFRDIEFSKGKLIVMESSNNGVIYLKNHQTHFPNVFLDGMSFNKNTGFLMGDQLNGYLSLYYSINSGSNWLPCEGKVKASENENAFAASGSTVHCFNDSTFIFVSGGGSSNFYKSTNKGKSWLKYPIPFVQSESSGPFSMAYNSENEIVVVGGDYTNPDDSTSTCFISKNGGKDWISPNTSPKGYRSCVIHQNGVYFTCGTNGLDYSKDGGINWKSFSNNSYFALAISKNKLVATTPNSSIELFNLELFN